MLEEYQKSKTKKQIIPSWNDMTHEEREKFLSEGPCKHGSTMHVYCADCHVERLQQQNKQLEEESRKYRFAMREEIQISAQVVSEREELIIENETIKKQNEQLIAALKLISNFNYGAALVYVQNIKSIATNALQQIQGNKT